MNTTKPAEVFHFLGIKFNIDDAIELTKDLSPTLFQPEPKWIMWGVGFEQELLDRVDLSKPVIFGSIFLDGKIQTMLIDGNHRVRKALSMEKVPNLPVLVLSFENTMKIIMKPYTPPIKKMMKDAKKAGIYNTLNPSLR